MSGFQVDCSERIVLRNLRQVDLPMMMMMMMMMVVVDYVELLTQNKHLSKRLTGVCCCSRPMSVDAQ